MSPSLALLQDRFVALRIDVLDMCLATIVEQILSLIEIFLLTRQGVKTSQSHLGNLVSWHDSSLSLLRPHLLDHAISITLGDVEELGATRSQIMSASRIHHVAEVVEFMAQHLFLLPSLVTTPSMRMLWVDGTGSVEIAIRFLCRSDHVEHTVDISLQLFVGIGLEDIASTFDGLIDIGIIERESHKLAHVPGWGIQSLMTRMLQGIGSHLEILVTVLALTLAESQRNRHFLCGLQTSAPKGVLRNLHTGKRNLGEWITIAQCLAVLLCHRWQYHSG